MERIGKKSARLPLMPPVSMITKVYKGVVI